jgi:LmbE family N-acetylglucosaminyl deacetylase
MLTFSLNKETSELQILCLGAHSDDIEIGCGGAILKLAEAYPKASFTWVVFSAIDRRADEALASAHAFLAGVERKKVIIQRFRDGFFPFEGAAVKAFFEEMKTLVQPDLIFTHYRDDRHQDHRLISDLTWNTFRDHVILEYEIPKYDGDLGIPNFFIHLSDDICKRKVNLLVHHFQTQSKKYWFTEETFKAYLRIRGIESRNPDEFAEAFYCRKIVLN